MAQIHRFGDKVAVYLGSGETVYLTVKEAVAISNAIINCAGDIGDNQSFADSQCGTFNLEIDGSRFTDND